MAQIASLWRDGATTGHDQPAIWFRVPNGAALPHRESSHMTPIELVPDERIRALEQQVEMLQSRNSRAKNALQLLVNKVEAVGVADHHEWAQALGAAYAALRET